MAVRASANDRQSYLATRNGPAQCSNSDVLQVFTAHQAFTAHPSIQFFVGTPVGSASIPPGSAVGSASIPPGSAVESHGSSVLVSGVSAVESRGSSVLFPEVSGPHGPTTDPRHASPGPQQKRMSFSRVSALTRLTSEEEHSCSFIQPVGSISPQLVGRFDSRSTDPKQIRVPLAKRPHSNDANNQLKLLLELNSRNRTLSENFKQFKSTIEGDLNTCTQAIADRKRMEERLQVLWQTSFSQELEARMGAVCRLDSEMMKLSAKVNELHGDVQRLTDDMHRKMHILTQSMHTLVQSMQSSVESAPQSQQVGQQRGVPASVSKEQKAEQGVDQQKWHQFAQEQKACQEGAPSLDRTLVTREDVFNGLSRCISSTETLLPATDSQSSTETLLPAADSLADAVDILSHTVESAAALHQEHSAGRHSDSRFVLERLLDETVQGSVRYSIVKEAIFKALDALGTKETGALLRDTCWTLQKVEELLTAKDPLVSGKDGLMAKKILDVVQANRTNILFGSDGIADSALGSKNGK